MQEILDKHRDELVLTTAKDWIKLKDKLAGAYDNLYVLAVELNIVENEKIWVEKLNSVIS